MERQYYTYIMASKRNGTLYVGVTGDLAYRVWQHKHNTVKGFTQKYGVHRLVYYEIHSYINNAILREKQIKNRKRRWKLELIERMNPQWKDLYDDIAYPELKEHCVKTQ